MRLLTFCTISALACQLALASVLAIDYGIDFITASLMKPGVPFDVLLNKDSKRKISSTVAWKKGDRLFGHDAFNTVCSLFVFRAQVSDSDFCYTGLKIPL
jgi:hypoxia up-regulated 1